MSTHINSTLSAIALTAGILGCASPMAVTTASNYRSRLTITRRDYSFFNAKYIGSEINHFPPPGGLKPIYLQKNGKYEPTQAVNMEEFSIYISDRRYSTSHEVKEFAHFIAANLAKQRHFSKFTVLSEHESFSGGTYDTANTYGSINGNTYTGTTTIRQNVIMANGYSLEVLFYNDQEPINQGLFVRYNSGLAKMDNRVIPLHDLYRGACPTQVDPKPIEISGLTTNVPLNAWKTHYEAMQLSEAIKQ